MMKKLAFAFMCVTLVLVVSCKKDKDDPKPYTCSDGKQNQGETGVDCGGPCNACTSTLCNGNGSNDYYPLAIGNSWNYNDPGTATFTNSINATATFGTTVYFKVDNSQGGSLYLRENSNGDIMAYNITLGTEYTYIPASPIVNQTWVYPLQQAATRKVLSTTATVTTPKCTYTNCLQIQHYDAGGNPGAVMYYKRSVGMVKTDELGPGSIDAELEAVTLQ